VLVKEPHFPDLKWEQLTVKILFPGALPLLFFLVVLCV